MHQLERTLSSLSAGDIFHADCDNGASAICLATDLTEHHIGARVVTTQMVLDFDRHTGVARWGIGSSLCRIDSVATLPSEVYQVMLGLDRKYRLKTDLALSSEERQALLFVDSFYLSHPLEIGRPVSA